MSSEDPTTTERNEGPQEGRARGGSDEADRTPKSEVPVRVKVSTPSTVTQETAKDPGMSNNYFTANPAAYEQHSETIKSYNSSPATSASASDVTTTGQIQPPDTLSALPSERPQLYSSQSAMSVQTVSSVATVTAASSAPALFDPSLHRPTYPNQSYAALHNQQYPAPHPPPLLKQRTAHPGQIATFTSALASLHQSGSRTVGSSPSVTPGQGLLFNPQTPPPYTEWDAPATPGTYASPFLHFTQRVPPKETHVADVDVDPISGRKLINHYEIIDELGRGTHGKVKLGRDLSTDGYVAIKIVERFSRRRKLGKLGTTEDKVKKEVAILKQARHPNVVGLLEVIDDPSRKKVYIVLEWVERGEIQWRTKAPNEVAVVEARRYEHGKPGHTNAHLEREDAAVLAEAQKRLSRMRRKQQRAFRQLRRDVSNNPEAWSNEMAGDDMSDVSDDDRLSRVSTESHTNRLQVEYARRASRTPSPLPPHPEHDHDVTTPIAEHQPQFLSLTSEPLTLSPTTSSKDFGELASYTGLEGTMYGAYIPTSNEGSRTSSIANSLNSSASWSKPHGSSDSLPRTPAEIIDCGVDPELEYVPLMSMQQTRVAFRDTLLGLQYLHYQGIVHRDIKPPNLLATKDHRVKISDFGVSYLGKPINEAESGEGVSEHETQDLADEARELAKTVGTPAFYAPELCSTDITDMPLPVTKAIDVWALGVTLFCMLYARTPFVDNEFVVMRQIAEEEIYLPLQRLKPVERTPRSRPSSHGRGFPQTTSSHRHALELSYEDIGDELHDLLKRLLTKDPRKRINLEEVRHHPWVVADLPDRLAWLEETDPNRQSQGKKIEVSKEDVNAAVVPLQFLDRVRSGIKKVGERLGFGVGVGQKPPGRGRAQSGTTTGQSGVSPSPSTASSSTLASRDSRRHSIRVDDTNSSILAALKTSREGEHPLSRSVAASPELDRHGPYFEGADVRPESALGTLEEVESTGIPRPGPPERANTVMATGGSGKTVRASDLRRSHGEESPPPSPGLPGTPTAIDTAASVLGSGWGSGVARRILKTVRERSTARSSGGRSASSDRGSVVSIDTHGEPSLAVSQTNVAGLVNPPAAFDEPSAPSSLQNSPSVSRRVSLFSSPSRERLSPHTAESGDLSRTSSTGSVSSIARQALHNSNNSNPSSMSPAKVKYQPAASTTAEWQRATDEHVRKLIVEKEQYEEGHNNFIDRTCPPSPDDHRQKASDSRRISEIDISSPDSRVQPSPVSQDSQLPPPALSSTSDFESTFAASASISNPSIPSVLSRASSVDPRDTGPYETVDENRDLMSSDDTLNPKARFVEEAHDEGYTADDNVLNSDEEYDSSSDSDGGLVMSRRKSATKAVRDNASAIKERRGTGLSVRSKKSSRSGSSNTMKKIRTRDSEDGRQRPSGADIAES
ncbi:hypothetical protein LTR09_008383 [Extremus antarcticus]|uniref:non-specific serine/threonine protein kinase n=1 Tax=Extremus antarcticus TaxID=702011 RepID=A0AAJ0DAT7_9PEZI|nr:hypothetical protein LTR09_008383 [Extremus antarcticus]